MVLGRAVQVWEVHVYGDVPQVIEEIRAMTPEAAVAVALNQLVARLEMKAYLKGSAPEQNRSTPRRRKKSEC